MILGLDKRQISSVFSYGIVLLQAVIIRFFVSKAEWTAASAVSAVVNRCNPPMSSLALP